MNTIFKRFLRMLHNARLWFHGYRAANKVLKSRAGLTEWAQFYGEIGRYVAQIVARRHADFLQRIKMMQIPARYRDNREIKKAVAESAGERQERSGRQQLAIAA